MTALKRSRDDRDIEALAMANCLMLLSRIGQSGTTPGHRGFTCKTCDRKFSSFQALGGHRASHKKPRLITTRDLNGQLRSLPAKTKTHRCPICGLEFAVGQALGGHMRRHRAVASTEGPAESGSSQLTEIVMPILKRASSSKRIMCLDLDLNLTPYENDVKLGKTHPAWLSVLM